MLYILLAILLFGVLIGVHELGHFLAAKACGVRVNEFALGMGPVIFRKEGKETRYSLRLLPIGGFCAMEGEEEASDDPRALSCQRWWKKLLIFVAGPGMNFLAGFLIILCLYLGAAGFYTQEIVALEPAFPQQGENGVLVGDSIYAIDGERVYIREDVNMLLELLPRDEDGTMELTLLRDGKKIKRTLTLQTYQAEDGTPYRAYGFSYGGVVKATPWRILQFSFYNTLDFLRQTRLSLQMLFAGAIGVRDLSGPVGIVSAISEMGESTQSEYGVKTAIENVLYFGALIAVNLGAMNLLPIPALDGGHVLFLLLNGCSRLLFKKEIPEKYLNAVSIACFALLMLLMVFVTLSDIRKLL